MERKRRFSIDIRSYNASAVTPGKKVHCALSIEPKMNIIPYPPPKGGSKTQNGRFPCKSALRLIEVDYKVFLCEYYQQQSCKAFTGLSIRVEMVRGERENLTETDQPLSKTLISNQYLLVRLSRNT